MSETTSLRSLVEIRALFDRPLLDLVFAAASAHREHHDPASVQCSQLLSIKTGGCAEDCGYCSQSARWDTPVDRRPLLETEEVVKSARAARDAGADRFCMGAAWREVRDGREFDRVLAMVSEVKALGLETCATLGMLNADQARRLRESGLDYYNHNLDTGESHYEAIVSTRTYGDRLRTLETARSEGLKLCCGGIIGMGESVDARAELLATLASFDPQPESVPINALVPIAGTPLEAAPRIEWTEIVRTVAVARLLMPRSVVRLSAGRTEMSEEAQALCFLAGANSIFIGEALLTTPNPAPGTDAALLSKLGLRASARVASN